MNKKKTSSNSTVFKTFMFERNVSLYMYPESFIVSNCEQQAPYTDEHIESRIEKLMMIFFFFLIRSFVSFPKEIDMSK